MIAPCRRIARGMIWTAAAVASSGAAVSCTGPDKEDTSTTTARAPTEFDAKLLQIAHDYPNWWVVYRDPHWTPARCASPRPAPRGTWMSQSGDPETHGRKLYDLFVLDQSGYWAIGGGNQPAASSGPDGRSPIGQAIVKESWRPVEVTEKEAFDADLARSTAFPLPAVAVTTSPVVHGTDGKIYRKGEKRDLFIMYKLDPGTPGTDQGWVYGTVTPDGLTVTSAGRVASCMECHAKAPHDRLFGMLPPK